MKIIYKYKWLKGSKTLYDYGYKQIHMITKEAKQRLKILQFWREYGIKATTDAYGAKRSTLYTWWNIYKESGYKVESLNPNTQARKNNNKREIHPLILKELRKLRLEVCPNMGKAKAKKFLDVYCKESNLPIYSESKIGRIIKEKKIYHHRKKYSHFGKEKIIKKTKKLRKPKSFSTNCPGDLVEIDTVVKYIDNLKRYIITAVDVHGRPAFALSYNRATSANTRDFYQKLTLAMPFEIKAIQTDNGSEFHKYFRDYLKEQNITHYWNYPGQPYKQGHIEKFNRTIQEEFVDQNEFYLKDTKEFNQKLIDWLLWYNTKRPHWALNLETPVDYLIKNNWVSNMCWTNTPA